MTVKLLTEHHFEFHSLKGGCTGSSESTLVKMPNCWKSHAVAQIIVAAFHFNLQTIIIATVILFQHFILKSSFEHQKNVWLRNKEK